MVGHHHEGIQFNVGIVPGHSHPRLVDQTPVCVEAHLTVHEPRRTGMRDGACRWSQNRPPVGHSRNHADGWSGAQIGRRRVVRPYFKRSAGPAILCARAGLKPAPTSASSGRGVGGRASCGFHGGVWLVVGGRWDRGATSPWAVLLVRARAGLKPAPTSASSGRGGGPGPPAGSTVGFGLWWAVGGTEGRLRLGLFCWCGRGRV